MGKLCQISRVKDSFDKDTLCLIISSLVMSKLFYCSSVWSNTSSKNVKKLQAVQNFACRIVSNTRKFDHITPAMEELEWLPIKDLLLYRNLRSGVPYNFCRGGKVRLIQLLEYLSVASPESGLFSDWSRNKKVLRTEP